MKISEMIENLKYELEANGDKEIIFDFDIRGIYFKDFYLDEDTMQIPPEAQIFFNNDTENLYIQNFPY